MNFWTATSVAGSTGAVHGLWILWAKYIAEEKAIRVGLTTVAIELFGFYVIMEFVSDTRYIIAACVGSFVGSTVPIWWHKYRKKTPDQA